MTKGSDNFPKTIVEIVQLFNNYKVTTRHQHNLEPNGNGFAFVQDDGRLAAPKSKIECWHFNKKGHYQNRCPELQVLDLGIQTLCVDNKWELDMVAQIPHIKETAKPVQDGWAIVQTRWEMIGVRDILSPYHVYIDMCASYARTLYPWILRHLTTQARGLVGHSNTGLCRMNSSGELGAIKQTWLDKGSMATINPLK
jgi:hypothetical protein